MTDTIVLVGAGGHCKACIDVMESTGKISIAGFIDKEYSNQKLWNYDCIGTDNDLDNFVKKNFLFLITIGQIKSSLPRRSVYQKIKTANGKLATVISASAIVSNYSSIGKGTIVMHHAIINAASLIGDNCIINNKALVEHDCVIGNHTHISTGAIINGGCKIGTGVFIGSNSVIAQNIEIADEAVIGAGSVVINTISEPGIYAGNPARKI